MKKNILNFIESQDHEGLQNELKNLKTNQKFLNETLKWASYKGDAKSVEILIKFGANPDYADEFGTTVLHFAVKGGKQDIVIELIKSGANFAKWESDGINLIQWCIRKGLADVLDVLVTKYKADLTELDDLGRSTLHLACMFGQVRIVEYILGMQLLSVDERDENGWTPLHYACSEAGNNFREVIQVLFRNNADPLLLTNNNKTSLDLAYESGRAQELIDVLTVHKMIQLLVSVDSVILGKISPREATLFNPSRTSEVDNLERQVTVKNIQFAKPGCKLQERQNALKVSIWRKIILNDDVELLQEYRDAAIWYSAEDPRGFEESQELSLDRLCEIFRDAYENGVGLYSFFNHEFRAQINRGDLLTILTMLSGINSFPALVADGCILFGSLHESILFLAFIAGRFKVVELLLKMRQFDVIPVCLMICLIAHRLQAEKNFPQQIIDNLQALTTKTEVIAVDVLNRLYFIDNSPEKQVTLSFLDCEMTSYGKKSLIDLADAANCSNFLSLPCCQLILDRRWYGSLRPLRTPLKWVIRFVPISILLYNPYNSKRSPLRSEAKADRSDETKLPLLRNKSKRVRDLKKVTSADSKMRSLNRFQVLYAVVNAPGTKFFYHSAAHLVFLLIMSYVLLFDFHLRLQWHEGVAYSFVLGYGVEEANQCFLVSRHSGIRDYLDDKWNWLDVAAITTTVIGFILRSIEHIHSSQHISAYDESVSPVLYVSRVFLLVSLMLFYLRILFISSISENLGPKLRMITDMLRKDFLPLLILFLIFILAFGVLFQGILYPNGWFHKNANNTNLLPKRVANSEFEVIGMLLIRAIYGIFEADFPIEETKCDDKDYCVHPLGKTLFISFCLIIYIVIVYIMLMNLLIALFSNTVARIDLRSMEHWLAGRYKLVQEYKERSIFPPPFNILERIFDIFFYCFKSLKCSSCVGPIKCSYKVVSQRESEVDIVVNLIIIQTFALKMSRYSLGSKDFRDIFSTGSASDKRSEIEIRALKDNMNNLEMKIDKILSALSNGRCNLSKEVEEQIIPKVCHFKFQEHQPKYESRRNSRLSDASTYRIREGDSSSPKETKNQEWNNNMEKLINVSEEHDLKFTN